MKDLRSRDSARGNFFNVSAKRASCYCSIHAKFLSALFTKLPGCAGCNNTFFVYKFNGATQYPFFLDFCTIPFSPIKRSSTRRETFFLEKPTRSFAPAHTRLHHHTTTIPHTTPHYSAGLIANCITMTYIKLLPILAFVALVRGHMEMSFPPPFRSKVNPFANPSTVDYSMTAPLSGAAGFPCKGYQSDLGTPAGASVVTWNQGAAVNISIAGSASHGGGSCQVSLSYDSGKTFKVIHSFIGGCPLTPTWNFNIPSDATPGPALFAWTWYNEIGNREIYMNCASITIGGGTKRASTVAFSSRPDIFKANIGNGCTTVEGQDVVFPDPGPDVTGTSAKSGTGFTGNCGGSSSGAASGSAGGGSSAASSPTPQAPVASPSPVVSSVSAPPAPSASPSNSSSSTGSTYTVVAGDYMAAIAQSKGITLAALEAANPQVTGPAFQINVGDVLQIPGSGSAPTSSLTIIPVTTSASASNFLASNSSSASTPDASPGTISGSTPAAIGSPTPSPGGIVTVTVTVAPAAKITGLETTASTPLASTSSAGAGAGGTYNRARKARGRAFVA
jgi:LysM repeat protein